jgi:hypothetical protein
MALEMLDRLAVPAGHGFLREATLAWWFVPTRYEPEFARVLEALWVTAVTPKTAGLALDFFRMVMPVRDFVPFRVHFLKLLETVQK